MAKLCSTQTAILVLKLCYIRSYNVTSGIYILSFTISLVFLFSIFGRLSILPGSFCTEHRSLNCSIIPSLLVSHFFYYKLTTLSTGHLLHFWLILFNYPYGNKVLILDRLSLNFSLSYVFPVWNYWAVLFL